MEHEKSGKIGIAALKAGMNRKTAAKYIGAGSGPSEEIVARDWRTRVNPFAEHWAEVESHLREAPELEGQALFEWLCEQYPGLLSARTGAHVSATSAALAGFIWPGEGGLFCARPSTRGAVVDRLHLHE